MTPRMAGWLVVSLALGACAPPPPRSLATANTAQAFAVAAEICGQFVTAILRGDDEATHRIFRNYQIQDTEALASGTRARSYLQETAGLGADIRGHTHVGHSLIRDQYRLHYRIEYFKSGEFRSELLSCGVSPSEKGGLAITYSVGFDRDIVRQLMPEERPTTDRPNRI